MTYDAETEVRPHRPGLMEIALRSWRTIAGHLMRHRTEAALSGLDDRMLKDIGVPRCEIAWRSRTVNPPRRYTDPL
jgi:uncharacterized protein YjiS (DUF1127 family)